MYVETTRAIRITVEPFFAEEQSQPARGRWLFGYTVTIRNEGRETVQLLRRHWRITDAHGRVQEVEGEGVVGEQPVLGPGQSFRYTSGAPLPTPSGLMGGTYLMANEAGEQFRVTIPTFSLDAPDPRRSVN
jgi:ApaG protein